MKEKAKNRLFKSTKEVFDMSCYDNLLDVCQLSIKGSKNKLLWLKIIG